MGIGNTAVGGRDLRGAVRRAGGLVDRARHRPRPRTASPTRRRWSGAASCATPARFGDPLEILRRLGGREIAALAGALLAARELRVPVLLDGFVAGAAAAVLQALEPTRSTTSGPPTARPSPATRACSSASACARCSTLDMRLGEASGAALAILLCRAALACHNGMATFASAGVSDRS